MHRTVTTTFSTDHGFSANDCSAGQSRPAEIAADPRDEFEHHLPALRAFALVLVGKRALADDIVARTIVAAWANIDAYDRGTSLRVWLFRMLRRVYSAQERPYGRRDTSDIDVGRAVSELLAPPVAGPVDSRFWRSFAALAVEQREALILIGPAEFSLDEATAVCGCTPGMLQHRAKLGRRKLAKSMPQDSRATNPASTVAGQTPFEIAGASLRAGAPGVPHRTRLAPPDGNRPSGGSLPMTQSRHRGAIE